MFPRLGAGAGLRRPHYGHLLADPASAKRADWFEVVSENFMVEGGRALDVLERIRATHPIVLHGVSLSIGSTDPLDETYLAALAALAARFDPAMVSDHLCWGSVGGRFAHDLLPIPATRGEAARIADRIRHVQDRLGRRILVENVSSYLEWKASTMPEWEFLAEVAERADCGLLLDVNNVWVSARNHGFDPETYLAGIPPARVGQFHLAGHSDRKRYLFDTHDGPVIDPVWALFEKAVRRFGPAATLIEWDEKIPEWEVLAKEVERARTILAATPAAVPPLPEGGGRGEGARRNPPAEPMPTRAGPQSSTEAFIVANAQLRLWAALHQQRPALVESLIVPDANFPATDRARVYASMYLARLHDALLEDFPSFEAAIGHDRFHTLVERYLADHPSTHPSLRHLGDHLVAYVRKHPASIRGTPWAADLAALEWARVEAFDAAEATPLDATALASIPPDRWAALAFAVHPSARLVACAWRVDAAWKQVDEDRAPSPPAPAEGALRVWRQRAGDDGTPLVFHAWMDPLEAEAFQLLLEGESFGRICDAITGRLGGDPETAAATAFGLLRNWLGDGLLIGLR